MTLCTAITLFVVGLLVALIGNIPVYLFWVFARVSSHLPWRRDRKEVGVPAWLTGTFERALAFALFYRGVSEAYTILGLWIGAKLAANWQRRSIEGLSAEK